MPLQVTTLVRFGDVERGRENNLKLIRLLLAAVVVLSHCYPILHISEQEPMQRLMRGGTSLGEAAVIGFFFLSGILITRSALQHQDPAVFLRARVLRIFPGLAVAVVLTVFVLGPLCTTLPLNTFFRTPQTWRYLSKAILKPQSGLELPGVFATHPVTEVNSPLWTLASEWTMYMLALLAAMLQRRSAQRRWLLLVALLLTAQMFPLPWHYAWHWAAAFLLGAAAYLLRARIPLSLPIAAAAMIADIALIRLLPHAGKPLLPFALCYLLLSFGYHPAALFRPFTRVGDFSYGIYIYAWPLQQILSDRIARPLPLFAASMAAVLPLAVLSWYLVEAPSLSLKAAPSLDRQAARIAEEPAAR
jgi:peptidoglycan/LPS O-acetylase OafA/YrhL